MKETVQHEKYGTIEFTEGTIIANRTITVNGEALTKKSNKEFAFSNGTAVKVVGGAFSGIRLEINDDVVQITNPGKWYEIAIYIAGLVLLIIWSSSYALVSIIPMVGGAIGGLLYAIPAVLGFNFSVKQKNPTLKLIITLSSVVIGLLLCVIVGVIMIALMA